MPYSQEIQVKNLHYRLTAEEWLRITQDLKYAECRVLYYLRTLDPFGDRDHRIKVVDIAATTGLGKGTVSKALRVLAEKEYINLEITEAVVRLKTFPTGNQVSHKKQEFPTGSAGFLQGQQVSCRKPQSTVGNLQGPEPLPDGDPGSPQTIQTFKTDQTLQTGCGVDKQVEESRKENQQEDDQLTEDVAIDGVNHSDQNGHTQQDPTISPQDSYSAILNKAKLLGVKTRDRKLLSTIKVHGSRLESAFACLEESRETVRNPTRFLQKALEEDWRPQKTNGAPEGWTRWFDEARKRGLAIGGMLEDGVQMVFLQDGHRVPFEQLRRMSWDELEARMHAVETTAVNVISVLGESA